MAHWIIEDNGFGGQTYRCSNCREAWNDLYDDISREDVCPECGESIDEDNTEYIETTTIQDVMIRASNKAHLTKEQLIDAFWDKGLMGVYNLGLRHMFEYLKK
ncbi:MAG: hypothetical protein IKY26_09565 [Erysipelotrichaceae bacterium]|nr:hypothetical protein [Erysipelotrichaceae bacterium]